MFIMKKCAVKKTEYCTSILERQDGFLCRFEKVLHRQVTAQIGFFHLLQIKMKQMKNKKFNQLRSIYK